MGRTWDAPSQQPLDWPSCVTGVEHSASLSLIRSVSDEVVNPLWVTLAEPADIQLDKEQETISRETRATPLRGSLEGEDRCYP